MTEKRSEEKKKRKVEKGNKNEKDNVEKDEESGARDMVHKLSEKNRRDRLRYVLLLLKCDLLITF